MILYYIGGSPIKLLVFVAMLPALLNLREDLISTVKISSESATNEKVLRDIEKITKQRLLHIEGELLGNSAGVAAQSDDTLELLMKHAVDINLKSLAQSLLYTRRMVIDSYLTYKELMGVVSNSYRLHPYVRFTVWVQYMINSLDPKVRLSHDQYEDVFRSMQRLTIVDSSDFPIVLDENNASPTLKQVFSVYKKGDDLTDLEWIKDSLTRGQALDWDEIARVWAANPVTDGALLGTIIEEGNVPPSRVFSALSSKNIMTLLRKSVALHRPVMLHYPESRVEKERAEFQCPFFFALWSEIVNENPLGDAADGSKTLQHISELLDGRIPVPPQQNADAAVIYRLLTFFEWVSNFGSLVATVPNQVVERTRRIQNCLVQLTILAHDGVEILTKLWTSAYFARLADITLIPIGIAFKIAAKKDPPCELWPIGMQLLSHAHAAFASRGSRTLSPKDVVTLIRRYDVMAPRQIGVMVGATSHTLNALPSELVAAMLLAEEPGWLPVDVQKALCACRTNVLDGHIPPSKYANVSRNVLSYLLQVRDEHGEEMLKSKFLLGGTVKSILEAAIETYAKSLTIVKRDVPSPAVVREAYVRATKFRARNTKGGRVTYNQDAILGIRMGTEVDKDGNPIGDANDLVNDDAMKGYKILVGDFYAMDGFSEITQVLRLGSSGGAEQKVLDVLRRKGFHVDYVPTLKEFNARLDPKKYHSAWVISSGRQKHATADIVEFEKKIVAFHLHGRGLFLWGDNDPFYIELNIALRALRTGFEVEGCTPGDGALMTRCPATQTHLTQGTFGQHPITAGLQTIYDGYTICFPNVDRFREVAKAGRYETVGISKQWNTVCLFCSTEAAFDEGFGRVIVDCGFTKLFSQFINKAGIARYMINCAVYLCAAAELFDPADDSGHCLVRSTNPTEAELSNFVKAKK